MSVSFVCNECRFTGSVKLKGIIVIGGEEDTHPSVMKLYVLADIFLICCFLWCSTSLTGNDVGTLQNWQGIDIVVVVVVIVIS